MGLNKGLGAREYLTIREGKIAKFLGDKKYELFDSVEGYIVGMSTRDTQYGPVLNIDLMDDQLYQLQIRIKGEEKPGQSAKQTSYFIALAHCSPNIDPTKKVEFIPSLKEVDGKKRSALFLNQNGQTLKWAFKKGDGMPEPEEVFNKKGELISIDWSEVEAFRMDKINEFHARVQEAAAANKMMAGEVEQTWQKLMPEPNEEASSSSFDEDDDLPF
ncbi:MAG: hypothetical protein EBR30_07470 [Cytophagia bacterium]|jgi:hypothetical protein|nr:hypothetical protein [Cytophagia bacterium]NBW34845.1 hypothetical protein [Cytophagia bacterium]